MTDVRDSQISRLLPAPAKIGHVPAIDGLRAIAVLAVIVYHAEPAWLPGGLAGVDIFFAISGFVVPASILWREFPRPVAALAFFYTRRIFRIFPALIVMLVATAFAVFLFVPRSWLGDGIVQTALAAFIGTSNIVLFGLEGDYFSPQALFNPFLHTWSLGVEEQFYVAFSILLFVLCLPRRAWAKAAACVMLLLLTIGSLVLAATMSTRAPAYAFYMLPARFWELGLGVLTYLALGRLTPWLRSLRTVPFALLVVACVVGLAASLATGTDSWAANPFPAVLPAVLATVVLMAATVARPKALAAHVLGTRPLRDIGLVSYSLYLWHWPVFVLMRWTCGFTTSGQIAIGIVVSIVLAALSYSFVEQPMRAFAAGSPRPVLITGGLVTTALATALVFGASKAREHISLSVTADAAVWFPYKIDAKLAARCKVVRTETTLTYGSEVTLTPECHSDRSDRTLFVAGDSHALALTRMLEGFASTTGMSVRIFARPGCVSIFSRTIPQQPCRLFVEEVFSRLREQMRASDALFLPGMRMPYLVGPTRSEPVLPLQPTKAMRDDASVRLAAVVERRVPVIVEAPQPVFATIPVRCSDWFNRNNPDCRGEKVVSRAAFEEARRRILDVMQSVARAGGDLTIWDPSGLACDDTACRFWIDGRPWVFDGDHASGYANDRMLPGFRDLVLGRLADAPFSGPHPPRSAPGSAPATSATIHP